MNLATVSLMDSEGALTWTGSLLALAHDNSMNRAEVREIVETLRGREGWPPEPAVIGGGAAPEFMVMLS